MYRSFLDELVHMHYLELMALLPVLLILSGLCFIVAVDPYIQPCWSGSRCIGTESA